MQSMPISNPSSANASSPAAAAALLPFDPQSPSPFTAVFQAVLKGAGNSVKLPLAGKPQDSSREPARITTTGDNLFGPFTPGLVPLTFAPVLPEPSLSVVAAPIPETPIVPGSAPAHGPAVSSNPIPSRATTGLAIKSFNSNITVQLSEALTIPLPSAASTANAANTVQAKALPQDLNTVSAIVGNNFSPQPDSNSSAGVSADAAPLQGPGPKRAAEQKPTSDSNGPANPTNVFLPVVAEQAIANAPIPDLNVGPRESGLSLNQDGSTNTLPGNAAQAQNTPAPTQNAPALMQTNPAPTQNTPAVAPAILQMVPTNVLNPPNGKTAQAALADHSFLNMQVLSLAGAATKASVTVPAQPATNQAPQSNPQPPAGIPELSTETLAHSVAKSAAVGVSTFKFHDNLEPPAVNPTLPAPVAAVATKTPSQDPSNGSSGNNSNSKPDHPSIGSNARTVDRNFAQAVDTAAANPMNGHSAGADSTAVAAAGPAQAQIADSGVAPAAPSRADSRPTEFLPTALQDAPIVNAAHIVNQPGQTEIRIEMQADSLGGVELRAHIAGDQIGASIAVEHHDAQVALATDLPALHSALAEKNLRVEILSVSQGTFSSLNGDSGQDHGQRGFAHLPAKFAHPGQPESPQAFTEAPAEWTGQGNSSAGLSVVA